LLKNDSLNFVKEVDFIFENSLIKIVALKQLSEIKLVGLKVGPFEEGNEYEVRFWIAQELSKAGIVRIKEAHLSGVTLYRIQWKERLQPIGEFSTLPQDFYPRLRRLLEYLKDASKNSPEAMREYEQVQRLFKDILNCRLRKIVSLASKSEETKHSRKNLTTEEQWLHEEIGETIRCWIDKIQS